jgi:hypothetical protein
MGPMNPKLKRRLRRLGIGRELASPKKIIAKNSIWKNLGGLLKFFEKF